jgi:hypothetical protein
MGGGFNRSLLPIRTFVCYPPRISASLTPVESLTRAWVDPPSPRAVGLGRFFARTNLKSRPAAKRQPMASRLRPPDNSRIAAHSSAVSARTSEGMMTERAEGVDPSPCAMQSGLNCRIA